MLHHDTMSQEPVSTLGDAVEKNVPTTQALLRQLENAEAAAEYEERMLKQQETQPDSKQSGAPLKGDSKTKEEVVGPTFSLC